MIMPPNYKVENDTYPQGVKVHDGVVLQVCHCTCPVLPQMYREDEPVTFQHLCIHLTPYTVKVVLLGTTASPSTLGGFAH